MKKIETKIPGVFIIEPDCFGDHRGWFMETYNKEKFAQLGINNDFVQDNMSYSAQKGTLRGLHFQKDPYAQAKLVRCTKGKIVDVAVDLRKGSPTYGQWVLVELSEENKRMFFLPRGTAHGFLTLTNDVEFQYKCDNLYNKESEGSVRFDDLDLSIPWHDFLKEFDAVLSDKDKNAPSLKDCDANFLYK